MKKKCTLFLLFFFILLSGFAQKKPVAEKGILDLRGWDFEKNGITELDGYWEFYWNEFYSSDEIKENDFVPNYVFVPYVWSSGKNIYQIDYPAYGFATYRLRVLLPKENSQIGLNIKNIRSAFKIWINGKQIFEAGKIAKKESVYKPGLFNFDKFFINQGDLKIKDTLEIVVQVSNFSTKLNSGINHSIVVGNKEQILKQQNLKYFVGFFAIGIFLIIGIYHLLVFLFRPKEKATLFFSLMSFSIAFRTLYNQDILENFFKNFYLTNTIDYGSVVLFGLFLSLYFYHLYKREFGKKIVYIFVFVSIFLIFLSFFPLRIIEIFYYFYFFIVSIPMIYIVFVVIPKAYKAKYLGVIWAFLGVFLMFIATISDFLYLRRIINVPFTTTYGFILFSIFESIYLAKRFSLSILKNEELNKELEYKNEHLEKIVKKRTNTINIQKTDLQDRNDKLLRLTNKLQSQNEELISISDDVNYKSKLLKIQAEELKVTNLELEKLSIVATHTDNIVMIFNKDFKLEWANNAFFMKYDLDLKMKLLDFDLIKNSSKENIREIIDNIVKTKKSYSYESNLINNDNIWFQTVLSPFFDENKLLKIVVIESDISEMKKAQKRISYQKDVIEESINYAGRIQNAMLPDIYEFDEFIKTFIVYKPKDIVSGDFYWIKKSPKNKDEIYIAVSDCTGHGVPGAFLTMIGITLLDDIVAHKRIFSPEKILNKLGKEMKILLKQNSREDIDGMDIIICKLNILTKKMSFSGAKSPLIIFDSQKNEIKRIPSDRFSIGGMHSNLDDRFTLNELTLNKNDVIYLTSDGFIDQNRKDRKKYGTKRLLELFKRIAEEPMNNQKIEIEKALSEWQQNEVQRDDITILGVKI